MIQLYLLRVLTLSQLEEFTLSFVGVYTIFCRSLHHVLWFVVVCAIYCRSLRCLLEESTRSFSGTCTTFLSEIIHFCRSFHDVFVEDYPLLWEIFLARSIITSCSRLSRQGIGLVNSSGFFSSVVASLRQSGNAPHTRTWRADRVSRGTMTSI